jgi:hypothetical protein
MRKSLTNLEENRRRTPKGDSEERLPTATTKDKDTKRRRQLHAVDGDEHKTRQRLDDLKTHERFLPGPGAYPEPGSKPQVITRFRPNSKVFSGSAKKLHGFPEVGAEP